MNTELWEACKARLERIENKLDQLFADNIKISFG